MKTTRHIAIALVLALFALGCGPRYSPLAAHTVASGENVQQDVVWVLQGSDIVLRCTNTQKGPVCVTARVQ